MYGSRPQSRLDSGRESKRDVIDVLSRDDRYTWHDFLRNRARNPFLVLRRQVESNGPPAARAASRASAEVRALLGGHHGHLGAARPLIWGFAVGHSAVLHMSARKMKRNPHALPSHELSASVPLQHSVDQATLMPGLQARVVACSIIAWQR